MKRFVLALALTLGAPAFAGALPQSPDHYLCYKAGLAKGQPKLPKGTTRTLLDRFAGPVAFDVKKIVAVCAPADRDGSGVAHPTIHLESYAIKAAKGTPKLAATNHVRADAFGQRTLTVSGAATLLEITPAVLGTVAPPAFDPDPTSSPDVNRFECHRAKLAKGSPKLAATTTTVGDTLVPTARPLVAKKVTKLCEPVEEDGATPGAASRPHSLVCYAVASARSAPRFGRTTVATAATGFAPHVLVATAPAELCLPAVEPAPTPTPTPTASPTPTPTATPSPAGKIVFVAGTSTNGAFAPTMGVAGADAVCASEALAAGLGGTFKAWLSVAGNGPATRFTQAAGPYVMVGGTQIASSWSDLVDGTLAHGIDRNAHGSFVGTTDVWTGTTTAGAPTTPNCSSFTSGSGAVSGWCGRTTATNTGWTQFLTPSCDTPLHLYCFEQ